MPKLLEKYETHDEFMAHRRSIFGKYEDYVPEFVYGGIDGAVTTFAIIAASAGAEMGSGVALILGISNMLADGFSMSVGSFLASRTEHEQYQTVRKEELAEIKRFPAEETEELREIYKAKGFDGKLLEDIIAHVTKNDELWADEMMIGEHDMLQETKHPVANGMITFVSFCVLGAVPILPYFWSFVSGKELENSFLLASIFTGVAFVVIGLLKGYVNKSNLFKAAAETLLLGGIAAVVAYGAGDWLEKLIV